MVHKFVTAAAWLSLCFIVFATLAPIQARPTFPVLSSFERLAAFAVLGMLFCLAHPRHVVLVTADRHGRIWDAIQKLAGGAAGILAGQAILYFKQAENWLRN
jgi:hypothetical protein